MPDNLINVFSRGNQELFHSAFIAWLLDGSASHELGDAFYQALRPHIGTAATREEYSAVTVHREFSSGRSRFDILLRPLAPSDNVKGIVIENKVKSFGFHPQLDKYADEGYDVAALALLPETLDNDTRQRYPVVMYRTVCEILANLPLNLTNGYHFVIDQYRSFIASSLSLFDLIRALGTGRLSPEDIVREFSNIKPGLEFGDNDIRTFNYFYYFNFEEYLRHHATDLVFGTVGYNESANTRWICEKNLQGPPYMECIIEAPF